MKVDMDLQTWRGGKVGRRRSARRRGAGRGEPLGEHGVGTLPRGELEDAIILGNIIIVIAPNEL